MTNVSSKQKILGPVFIVGMNGSGTTMLSDCLDNAPELYAFPRETRMVPWLIEHLDEFGDLQQAQNLQRLLDTFCGFHVISNLLGADKLSVSDVAEPTLYGVIDAVYAHLAKRYGKARWIEKSPMNIQFMVPLSAQIPTAKFLHIYRDGRDVAQSNQRRWQKNPYLAIYRWKQVVRQGRIDGQTLGSDRYHEISYEALTQNPEPTMRGICEFLDIAYRPELLQSSMPFVESNYSNRAKGKTGTIVSTGQKWRTYFSVRQIGALERIGGALLAELGYEVTNQKGDSDIPFLRRRYWRLIDMATQGWIFLRRYRVTNLIQGKGISRRFIDRVRYISVQKY